MKTTLGFDCIVAAPSWILAGSTRVRLGHIAHVGQHQKTRCEAAWEPDGRPQVSTSSVDDNLN